MNEGVVVADVIYCKNTWMVVKRRSDALRVVAPVSHSYTFTSALFPSCKRRRHPVVLIDGADIRQTVLHHGLLSAQNETQDAVVAN